MEPQEKRKIYQEPMILHELELETRAGSGPIEVIRIDSVEFDE